MTHLRLFFTVEIRVWEYSWFTFPEQPLQPALGASQTLHHCLTWSVPELTFQIGHFISHLQAELFEFTQDLTS